MERLGLIAGNGRLPILFAQQARANGLSITAVGHRGETEPGLEGLVDSLTWVRVGQIDRIRKTLIAAGISRAVMAGGITRVKTLTEARPDFGALKIALSLRTFRDDALLRAVAAYFEGHGVTIVSPAAYLAQLLAPEGHLAGPPLDAGQQKDVALGIEVATTLGRADVGQAVVVKAGHVLALEAVEGTDETIRRGAKLGGKGAVVVKLCKLGQDERFDLPAAGPTTIEVMKACGARVLAVEAEKTLLLDAEALFRQAEKADISVVGVRKL